MYLLDLRLFLLGALMLLSSSVLAVCENGSSVERLSCMRGAFCPKADTVEERTACYQMITEALRKDRLSGNRPVSEPREKSKKTNSAEAESSQQLPEQTVQSESPPIEKKKKTKRRAKDKKEKKEKKGFELFGWAKSDKRDDYGPEWTRVVFVRRESSGAELVVLEGGAVFGEKKRNGFVTLSKGDWVKVKDASLLIRRGGGSTEVVPLDCKAGAELKGRCRGLERFL